MQSAAVFQLHLTGKQKTSAASKHCFSTAFPAPQQLFFFIQLDLNIQTILYTM